MGRRCRWLLDEAFRRWGTEAARFFSPMQRGKTGQGLGVSPWFVGRGKRAHFFYYLVQPWGKESLRRLQADVWSMPAGEMIRATMMLLALGAALPTVSHMICFTDIRRRRGR